MPTNLEFKASISSAEDIRKILKSINAKFIETIKQLDTYFHTKYGRLKIREINESIYQLIYYNRDEKERFRLSEYKIYEFSNKSELNDILKKTLEIRGVVEKRREVYLYGQCRIHIDKVANLGEFIEFEYTKGEDYEKSNEVINYLYTLILPYISRIYKESYIDMIYKNGS